MVPRRSILACLVLAAAPVVAGPMVGPQDPVSPVQVAPPFEQWLAELRTEAEARGIRREVIDRALVDIQPSAQILERDRTQAEFTLDLDAYLKRRLTRQVVRTARERYARHTELLRQIGTKYGVTPRVLVAVWGLESNFGRFSGVRPTIPALVTLAYDARRGPMFRSELFNALEIVNRGDIELERLKGSWAGALGQPQFMPSSYLEFAQDFDGDGRRDIWSSQADVFASVANYLQKHGWTEGTTWGREVMVPPTLRTRALALPRREEGCRAERTMTPPQTVSAWRKMGIRTLAGTVLPSSDTPASLVQNGARSFLLYPNYNALLGYNCAHSYALSVALLADRLK